MKRLRLPWIDRNFPDRSKKGTNDSSTRPSRRTFMKGAATVGVGTLAATGTMLTDVNRGAKAAGEPIPIGFMSPLTGPVATDGIHYQNGVKMAIEEINEMGGILGQPLELVSIDTKNMSTEEVVPAADALVYKHEVHAIINGYNIGPKEAEYEPIADAGIIYMHQNTAVSHVQLFKSDPERYFGCFMSDPAEVWYGRNFPVLLGYLRDSGLWTPPNNKIAVISGSSPYSIVIANEIENTAAESGFEVVFKEIVPTPTTEWGPVLSKVRDLEPAAIANTHYYPGDIAQCQIQFTRNPTKSLVFYQWGALLRSFYDIAGEANAPGVLTASVIGVLPDNIGKAFIKKYTAKFGEGANYDPAGAAWAEMHHYAIAAAVAGGSGEPGNYKQNKRIAENLLRIPFRGPTGMFYYQREWNCPGPYPSFTKDPTQGMPTTNFQIKSGGAKGLISRPPYNDHTFELPPWFDKA